MPPFGSHLSIAGGYYRAADSAAALGMDCVQIFTKNNNQWRAAPLTDEHTGRFALAVKTASLSEVVAHNSYLINLASPDDVLWQKSIDALVIELERAHRLGIRDVVAHPGAHCDTGEEIGLARIAAGLDQVLSRTSSIPTRVALETTAGQGSCLGHRFEHLAAIMRQCRHADRLTVCLDTCHLFAAGYPLAPKRKYLATIRELDRVVGIERVVAIHMNDSKRPFGSRVDRHEHIGRGFLGREPFAHFIADRRFRRTPMILETPKGIDPATGREWDRLNLRVLRRLGRSR